MSDDLGAWEPLSLELLAGVMAGLGCPWWVAGGWAIDLHLGRVTRVHEDLDVLVLRRDHLRVQRHLSGWDLHAADPPGTLRRWGPEETLPDGVHDIWCRRTPAAAWSLQLMLAETSGEEWVYRHDTRIRRPVSSLLGPASTRRLPVLAPEVQLLHKSRSPREKDEADHRAVVGALSPARRTWLQESLALVSPGSPWSTDRSG